MMDFDLFFSYVSAVLRELWRNKLLVLLGFAMTSFTVLLLGMTWPVKYETSTTIFADNQNILKPLLAHSASTGKLQDSTRVVQDAMYSPRIMMQVVEDVYKKEISTGQQQLDFIIKSVRSRLKVTSLGPGYIKVAYSDDSADRAYKLLNGIADIFISYSAKTQRLESKEAFQFIDAQVKRYKMQLIEAENRLKEFTADDFDGNSNSVIQRITVLRDTLDEMKILIDEKKTRIASLEEQLSEENKLSARKYKQDAYYAQLSELRSRLSAMRLTYKDSYPDVISLKYQIEELKKTISEIPNAKYAEAGEAGVQNITIKPLYEELRSKLADATVDLKAVENRQVATINLLDKSYDRQKRVAAKQADLAELSRDYMVTKKIYEDMLERKEKARLSMTLSVEGQGVAYRVQEPAVYPLTPTSFGFFHFVLAGPVLGILLPIALTVLFILADPRVRFVRDIERISRVPVFATLPHFNAGVSQVIFRSDVILVAFLSMLVLAAYAGVAFAHRAGVI